MSKAQEKLNNAMHYAFANRPEVGGFPFLAECLAQAGVTKNIWNLPSAQSIYIMECGSVVSQGKPLIEGFGDVVDFDKARLVSALRKDQVGESSFEEFLMGAWQSGVVSYEVDFLTRKARYFGARGESYSEEYAKVEIGEVEF